MLIGLSGYAQSGKDTVGAALVKNHGFTRYAFADALKECVYRLNPVVGDTDVDPFSRLQDFVDHDGWEVAKKNPEVRRLLQVMGTEAGRQVLGENIWVDAVLNKVGDDNVVITDCRFPNEAQGVKDHGGFVVRVVRDGVVAVNDHPSETSLDDWPFDLVIYNSGTLDDVEGLAKSTLASLEMFDKRLQLF
jgi:hypothetical protein